MSISRGKGFLVLLCLILLVAIYLKPSLFTQIEEDSNLEREEPKDEPTITEDGVKDTSILEVPIFIRMVSSSDWTTLTIVGNVTWIDSPSIVSEHTHGFDGESFYLNQPLHDAQEYKTVEVTIEASIQISAEKDDESLEPSITFEIERGHIGWTHIQLLNNNGDVPKPTNNYWWCGVKEGPRNYKRIQVPLSNFNDTIPSNPIPSLDTSTLYGKVILGYQGWFASPGDGSDQNEWIHWFRYDNTSRSEFLTVDYWPDMTEYGPDERYPTEMELSDGSSAELYSSFNQKSVLRHFQWMEEYRLDGVALQRFYVDMDNSEIFCFRNKVAQNVMMGAEKHGRVFYLMYDGLPSDLEGLKKDWMFMVDVLGITESPNYLHHKGKPLLTLFGIGLASRELEDKEVIELLDWFQEEAPEKYRATVIGGVPTYWRTLSRDSYPDAVWRDIYLRLDVISPWTVGRYSSSTGVDSHKENTLIPDLAEASAAGVDYMPVIWPGFSWHNLYPSSPINQIPRENGEFIWHQAYNAVEAGSEMLYIAMFDEVDEGTAMFKLSMSDQLPVGAELVSVDSDDPLQSDHYLRVGEYITGMLHGEILLSPDLPPIS